MIDFAHNHFELFGLPALYRVDLDALDDRYRDLQRDVHPDRAAGGDDAQQRVAMQASARVNEAYRTLKDPVERGRYLLELAGIDALAETDTSLALPFLEQQLERREQAADARDAGDIATLESIIDVIRDESAQRQRALADRLDAQDVAAARVDVRELKFLQKVAADVAAMIETIDV
ncbi:MAG: Fe-S protein assembly co-chaperone HscB [Betaproteobacteria bacterium]